jgi:hypothetical protein
MGTETNKGRQAAMAEFQKSPRHFYAGHSYMGTNYTYDSPCWSAYAFSTKAERDEWLDKHSYKDGNLVAEPISRRDAFRIAGISGQYVEPGIVWHSPGFPALEKVLI